jgi:hypothetical protein
MAQLERTPQWVTNKTLGGGGSSERKAITVATWQIIDEEQHVRPSPAHQRGSVTAVERAALSRRRLFKWECDQSGVIRWIGGKEMPFDQLRE